MNTQTRPAPLLTAIGSGKGGTGKTLVTVTLAQALAHKGERVLLCDADLGLSNVSVHLGVEDCGDLGSLLSGACALGDAVVPVLGGAGTWGGFDLIAGPAGSGALANGGAIAAEALIAKLRQGSAYTRVLIDLAAGVDAAVIAFAAAADETILVLSPEPTSLTDAYAFTKLLLRATGTRMPRVIINMATNAADGRRAQEAMAATCSAFLNMVPDFLGTIPRDSHAQDAVRRQHPLMTLSPQAPASRALTAIANELHERAPSPVSAPIAGAR